MGDLHHHFYGITDPMEAAHASVNLLTHQMRTP
jgi:hypothetical protein